jgi:hypothetical protein
MELIYIGVNQMTKDELIGEYATRVVRQREGRTLVAYTIDQLINGLSTMSEEDLREEIADFYPDLLEEN